MPKIEIKNPDELREWVGKEVAVSDWLHVTQEHIDQFADATGDHQWNHVDTARAAQSRFGGTIAHGVLTVSAHWPEERDHSDPRHQQQHQLRAESGALHRPSARRQPDPRPLHARATTADTRWRLPAYLSAVAELEGSSKPACVAETISRLYN
jgi:hypothetical protein